jgi:hypothetical protein
VVQVSHVVPVAEKAKGTPREAAVLFVREHHAEVRRATADVADQQDLADVQILAPRIADTFDPRVECCLRLLEQVHAREARVGGGADGQVARDGIERRRHRQVYLLALEPRFVSVARDDVR